MTVDAKKLLEEAYAVGLYQQKDEILTFVEFLQNFELKNVLEVGTQDGGTFLLWSKLSKPDGIKITLDLPNGPYSTRGLSEEDISKRDTFLQSLGPNVHVLNMNSHDATTIAKVKHLLHGEKLDLLFIDGDHRYEGVALDFSNYQQFVKPGGIIAFHDIAESEWHISVGCFVFLLWARLKTIFHVTYEFGPYENWGGIGALQPGLDEYPSEMIEFAKSYNAKKSTSRV